MCRVLNPTPDLLAQGVKLELLGKVPHELAFAFPSSFTLPWPSPLLTLSPHKCTHCSSTQKYSEYLNMLGSSFLWTNSLSPFSSLPNLVKFLSGLSLKPASLSGLSLLPFPPVAYCCFWAFLGTSQLAPFHANQWVVLCTSHLLRTQGHLVSLIKCFSIKLNALKQYF